jgi:hypothetical protein
VSVVSTENSVVVVVVVVVVVDVSVSVSVLVNVCPLAVAVWVIMSGGSLTVIVLPGTLLVIVEVAGGSVTVVTAPFTLLVTVVVFPGTVVVPPAAVTTLVFVKVDVTVLKFGSTNAKVLVTNEYATHVLPSRVSPGGQLAYDGPPVFEKASAAGSSTIAAVTQMISRRSIPGGDAKRRNREAQGDIHPTVGEPGDPRQEARLCRITSRR